MAKPDSIKRIEDAYGLELKQTDFYALYRKTFSLDEKGNVNGLNLRECLLNGVRKKRITFDIW